MLMIGLENAQMCCRIISEALTVGSQRTVMHVAGVLMEVRLGKGIATENVHVQNVR